MGPREVTNRGSLRDFKSGQKNDKLVLGFQVGAKGFQVGAGWERLQTGEGSTNQCRTPVSHLVICASYRKVV